MGLLAMSAETDRFEASMNARKARLLQAVRPALEKGATELQASTKSLAPKDTGALANSIAITLPGDSTPAYSQPGGARVAGENEVLVTAGNEQVRYAHLIEFGSVHGHAQPFFFISWRFQKKRITDRIKRALRKAIKLEQADQS